jgi:phage baseplate assembly protein W
MTIYNGFSTYNRIKKFRVTDFELAKQDLINYLNTKKGERVMQPDFGTMIWSSLFEPFTETLRQSIIDDIKQIINYDPRLGVTQFDITEQQYGIQIMITLVYRATNQVETLKLQFDKNSPGTTKVFSVSQ